MTSDLDSTTQRTAGNPSPFSSRSFSIRDKALDSWAQVASQSEELAELSALAAVLKPSKLSKLRAYYFGERRADSDCHDFVVAILRGAVFLSFSLSFFFFLFLFEEREIIIIMIVIPVY